MTIAPQTALKTCLVAGAVLALSACNTMGGDREIESMDHMMGAMLTGAAEAPGPGDAKGKGHFHYTLNMNSSQLCYEIKVEGIAAPTAAHIHEGIAGVAGGVVTTLETPVLGSEIDTCMNIDPELARRIMANPASFYVNVHNAAYPGGAVRGQLMTMTHDK